MAKAITILNDISMLFFAFYVISNNGRPGLLQTGQKIQHLAGYCFLPGGRMYADCPQLLPQNAAQCLLQCFLFPAPQDRSRHKRRFLSFQHSLQDLPRTLLLRIAGPGTERKAGPFFHWVMPRAAICCARRSKPAALIRLSVSGITRHSRSLSRRLRAATPAPAARSHRGLLHPCCRAAR